MLHLVLFLYFNQSLLICLNADEVFVKDALTPGSQLLQMVAEKLNIEDVPWIQNWRRLAHQLEIPSDVYRGFDESTSQRKSCTREVLQWLVVQKPPITLFHIVEALEKIQRNDAIQIITQQFPDTVGE